MKAEDWDELEAQVESHGPEVVEFILVNADEKLFTLGVTNIEFVDGSIRVELT